MQIRIITKTIKGKDALQKHIVEYMLLPRSKRFMLERLWLQRVSCDDPYIVTMSTGGAVPSGMLDPNYLIEKTIRPVMLENGGAVLGEDYDIEVS